MGRTTQVAANTGGSSAKLGSSLRPYASETDDDVELTAGHVIERERLEFIEALESIKADRDMCRRRYRSPSLRIAKAPRHRWMRNMAALFS
jgi:hypothetical protein